MKRTSKKYFVIAFIIIAITSFIIPANATRIENESSLEINFITENDTLPMDNVDISIYKLASYENGTAETQWKDIYANYTIDLTRSTDEEILAKTAELADFVKSNNINSDYKLTTNSVGKAKTTFENGVYLICGAETIKNKITYTPTPCIIQLPYTDEEGTLIYEATIKLKYERKDPENPIQPAEPITPPTEEPIPPTIETGVLGSTLPDTGDIILIVVGILILVISLNIIQMLNGKRKNKNKQ